MHPVIEWKDGKVLILDQRLLPQEERYIEHTTYTEVAKSIKDMVIRGAPAIGVAAAMGIALGILNLEKTEKPEHLAAPLHLEKRFSEITDTITRTRPTAANLFWAVERMKEVFNAHKHDYQALKQKVVEEALAIDQLDVEINKRIGRHGHALLQTDQTVLTYCNAGMLATSGYGTALGVVRAALEAGKKISVIASETRPYLQGARLTVWELQKDHIPVTLITDNMAGHVMKKGMVHAVIVGADRIAANGDTANKIGTYSLAVLARYHRTPFYVAAPVSTIDFKIASGSYITIEERPGEELLQFRGQAIASPETRVYNPAFDVTPAELINAIITEKGVLRPDFRKSLATIKG